MVTPLRILGNDAALTDAHGVDGEGAVRAKRVFIETFGCQMNVLDSELVRDQLLQQGYRFVSSPDDADVVLYNTCSVRDQSEQKVLSRLGIMRARKKERPELVVGMLGCMAERAGDLAVKKGADVVVGPSELDRLPELLERAFAGQGRQVALSGHTARRSRTLDEAMDRLEALDQGRLVDPARGRTEPIPHRRRDVRVDFDRRLDRAPPRRGGAGAAKQPNSNHGRRPRLRRSFTPASSASVGMPALVNALPAIRTPPARVPAAPSTPPQARCAPRRTRSSCGPSSRPDH
jgi:hypothetical protein